MYLFSNNVIILEISNVAFYILTGWILIYMVIHIFWQTHMLKCTL